MLNKAKRTSKASRYASVDAKIYIRQVNHWLQYNRLARLVIYWLVAFLLRLAFFFSRILKDNNYLEVFPSEMIFPIVMHAITALIIALVIWLLPRPKTVGAKMVTVLFLALSMVNYDDRLMGVVGIFRSILPILPKPDNDIPVISLFFLSILLILGVIIGSLIEKLQAKYLIASNKNMAGATMILIGTLFFGQAIPTFKILQQVSGESRYKATSELQQAASMHPDKNNRDKPDIYYIVLEDYENNAVLKSQFGVDNSIFMNWLRQQDFNVDENAMSQYPFTASSVASTLNMSYLNNDIARYKDNSIQSATLFFNMVRQAEVAQLLKQQGYSYYALGNHYGAMNKAPLANIDYSWDKQLTVFGQNKRLRGMESQAFLASPYYRFAKIATKWWPVKISEINELSQIRNQLTTLDQLAKDKQQGGRFIFANILAPHTPPQLNADCSISATPGEDNVGAPIKQKYFGEVQCMNSQIKEVISDINENSHGQAVVLLVSDEGQSPANMNRTFLKPSSEDATTDDLLDGSMLDWSEKDLQMKFGILQAVHIPQATEEDLRNMSSVNAFRVVLNRYFGYSFDYLPNCQFGSTDGRRYWYKYKDVTQRTSGTANSSCKQYE